MGNCLSSDVEHVQQHQAVGHGTAAASPFVEAGLAVTSQHASCCMHPGQQGQQQVQQQTRHDTYADPAGTGPQPQQQGLPSAELECLLDCVCKSLHTPFSLVSLIHSDNQCWLHKTFSTLQLPPTLDNSEQSVTGSSCTPLSALHASLCKWSSSCNGTAVSSPQTMVCQDVAADHEADSLPWRHLGLASYAAAPMMAANGQALGWLVVGDAVPRRMDAGMCRVLNNLAEVAIRIIERHVLLVHRLNAARVHVPRQLRQLWQAAASTSNNPSASLESSLRTQHTHQPCELHSESGAGHCICTAASMAWEDDDMVYFPELQAAAALPGTGGLLASSHAIPSAMTAARHESSLLTEDLWRAPTQQHLYSTGKQPMGAGASKAGFLYGAPSMQDRVSETWGMAGATASWPVLSDALTSSTAAPEQTLMMNAFTRLLRSQHQALQACVLIIDTSKPGWPVMYADKTWRCWAGYSRNHILGKPLMALIMPASEGCAAPRWELLARKAQACKRFILPGVCACGVESLHEQDEHDEHDEAACPSDRPNPLLAAGRTNGAPSITVGATTEPSDTAGFRASLDAMITIQDAQTMPSNSWHGAQLCPADTAHVYGDNATDAKSNILGTCLDSLAIHTATEGDGAAMASQQLCASDVQIGTVSVTCRGVTGQDKPYQHRHSWDFQDLQTSESGAAVPSMAQPKSSGVRTLIDAVHPHSSRATWHGLDLLMPEEPHHALWGLNTEGVFAGFSVAGNDTGAAGTGMMTTHGLPAAAQECNDSGYISEKTSVLLARIARLAAAGATQCPSSQLCPLPSAPPLLGSTATGSSIVLPACPLSAVTEKSHTSQLSAFASSSQPPLTTVITGKLDTSALSIAQNSSTGVGGSFGSSMMHLDSGFPRRTPRGRGCLGHHFDLSFRPIALDLLDRDTLPSGIPSHTTMTVDPSVTGLYAVRLHQQGLLPTPPDHLTPNGKLLWGGGSSLPTRLAAEVFPDLQLDHLLGRGGYGVAFHGLWHDSDVVLKLQDLNCTSPQAVAHAQLEVYLGQQVGHPNVVRTLTHATLEMPGQPRTGPNLPARTARSRHALAAACGPFAATDTCLFNRAKLQEDISAMATTPKHKQPCYASQQPCVQPTAAASAAGNIGSSRTPADETAAGAPQDRALAAWPPAPEALGTMNPQESTDLASCVLSLAPEQASASVSGCHVVATAGPYAHRIAEMDSFCGFDLQRRPGQDQYQQRASQTGQPATACKLSQDSPSTTSSSPGSPAPALPSQTGVPGSYLSERAAWTHLPSVAEEAATLVGSSQLFGMDGHRQPLAGCAPAAAMGAVRRPLDQPNKWKATVLWLDEGQQQAGSAAKVDTQASIPTALPNAFARGENPLQALQDAQPSGVNPASWPGVELPSNQGTWHCKLLQHPVACVEAPPDRTSASVRTGALTDQSADVHLGQAGCMEPGKAADAATAAQTASSPSPPRKARLLTIHEFCDGGSLQNTIDKGWFRYGSADKASPVDITKVLSVACDIASGLAFLHSCGVIHADLSAANVLLCTLPTQDASTGQHMLTSYPQLFPYSSYQSCSIHDASSKYLATKYVAKIADFGKAVICTAVGAEDELVAVDNYATVTFMAPEVLQRKQVSRQADIYSLGVLLWQMLTGQHPWPGCTHQQVVELVANQAAQLEWPDVHIAGPSVEQADPCHTVGCYMADCQPNIPQAKAITNGQSQPSCSHAGSTSGIQQGRRSAVQQGMKPRQQWGTLEQVKGFVQLGRLCLHADRLQRPSAVQVVERLQQLMHSSIDSKEQDMHARNPQAACKQ